MLCFNPVTLESLPEINKYFQNQNFRTCDFTIGGLFMWASYFEYEYAIFKKTLFIKGLSEMNLQDITFSIPIGKLPMEDAINLLIDFCKEKKMDLILSAIPEQIIDVLLNKYSISCTKLENWSDYLYDIKSLATLQGKQYNKKRNHINKFYQLYQDYSYSEITTSNLPDLISFFQKYNNQNIKDNPIFQQEKMMTDFILKHYSDFNFIGSCLKINNDIAGFIIGEILHDTLYIHINKADKSFEGIYEFINKIFIEEINKNYPSLKYVNKEEDVGDKGLRKSKLSYHPIKLLNKYNLNFNPIS
jgi:hypothetical protein